MAQDINKHLDRARRSLEKSKLREAATEYQVVLEEVPSHQEALQALADIHTRLNEPAIAAQYYGIQFDRLIDGGDASKASAIFTRFLRTFPQPPDRLMRYATLLQKQSRAAEAIEQYGIAAELYLQQHRDIEALACYESMAVLDPENPARHVLLGELAERMHHADLASRSYLRAGQLVLDKGGLDEALDYFGRAHALSPGDRSVALLYSEARLRKGDAPGAVELLDPLSHSETDPPFLALFGEALLRAGQLDRAREVFEAYYKQKPDSLTKLFEVSSAYVRKGEEAKALDLLSRTQETMLAARKEAELCGQMDKLAADFPASLALAEAVAGSLRRAESRNEIFRCACPSFRSVPCRRARAGRLRNTRSSRRHRSLRLPQPGSDCDLEGKLTLSSCRTFWRARQRQPPFQATPAQDSPAPAPTSARPRLSPKKFARSKPWTI